MIFLKEWSEKKPFISQKSQEVRTELAENHLQKGWNSVKQLYLLM
jgi:hypothetical protein